MAKVENDLVAFEAYMLLNVSVSTFMTSRSSGKSDCKRYNIFSAVLDRSIRRAIFLRVKCIKLIKVSHKKVNYMNKKYCDI
jgi:hypothetical protein